MIDTDDGNGQQNLDEEAVCIDQLLAILAQCKRAEDYERFRSQILEMMVSGADLHVILEAIVYGVEQLYPQMLCCIQLLNADRTHLGDCISPSLPQSYTQALNGIEVRAGCGSCGTSAATGEPVIVENIQQHPYWMAYKDLAGQAGLQACWSQPIRAGVSQNILGAFAVYHRQPAQPTADDLSMMKHTARLIGLVLMKIADEEKIRQLAFYDPLTQLPNRRLLSDRLNQVMSNCRRTQSSAALLLLDLDNFKPLNDRYGHAIGDQLLVEVANRLKSCVREVDTVSRLGGDEFVVLLNGLGSVHQARTQAVNIAEKIRQVLMLPYSLPTVADDNEITEHQCSSSIGVVVFDGEAPGQQQLLRQADMAMYAAKQAGRNQVYLAPAIR